MSDNLNIFGEQYNGVTGIIATNTNDTELTYIHPQGTMSITQNGSGIDVSEYATVNVSVTSVPSLQSKTISYTPSESGQSDSVSADSGYDGLSSVNITVVAVSSDYIGSGVTRRSATDLAVSGDTVTIPDGYYSSELTKSVAPGSTGTPVATKGTVSGNSVSITPSVTNTTGYITGGTKTGNAVTVNASELVSGTYSVTSSGTKDVTNFASASVPAGTEGTPTATKGTVSNHSVSVTPSVTNASGFISGGTKSGNPVSVSASELVSGTLSITSSGTKDVTNYESASVPAGSEGTPTATKGTVTGHSVTVTPSVVNTTGFITGGTRTGNAVTVTASELVSGNLAIVNNGTNISVTNYDTVSVNVQTPPNLQSKSVSYTPSETSQTVTVEPAAGYDGLSEVEITVGAISTTYVGSGITRRSGSDLTASGATVTVPAGYYSSQATKSIQSGTAGTPIATKGTVSNHTIAVTPSVENVAGYISSGSMSGTAVTVSASELVSGNLPITSNGSNIDVTNYSTVSVDVSGGGGGAYNVISIDNGNGTQEIRITDATGAVSFQQKSVSYTPSETSISATVSPDSGYDGLSSVSVTVDAISSSFVGSGVTRRSGTDLTASGATVTVPSGYYSSQATKSVSNGTEGTPSATKGTVNNHSVSVTPSVTNSAGYISGGTKTGTAVTVTASELASGNKEITANGTNIDVVGYSTVSVAVPSGGSSKNIQIAQGIDRVATTSYTAVSGQSITVSKTGTYDVYWTGFRSSTGGTNGSQLYIGDTAYGTAQTTFSNHGQSIHLSNVALTQNQTISVYARARGTSYYMYVGNLTIIEA